MEECDREALLYEAMHPDELPEGEEVAPEILAQQALARSSTAQLLDEIYRMARDGTPADQPVPPERFLLCARELGLDGIALDLLQHLRAIDHGWRSDVYEEQKRQLDEQRTSADAARGR